MAANYPGQGYRSPTARAMSAGGLSLPAPSLPSYPKPGPLKMPVPRVPANVNIPATKAAGLLGRGLGRFVPVLGWVIVGYELYQLYSESEYRAAFMGYVRVPGGCVAFPTENHTWSSTGGPSTVACTLSAITNSPPAPNFTETFVFRLGQITDNQYFTPPNPSDEEQNPQFWRTVERWQKIGVKVKSNSPLLSPAYRPAYEPYIHPSWDPESAPIGQPAPMPKPLPWPQVPYLPDFDPHGNPIRGPQPSPNPAPQPKPGIQPSPSYPAPFPEWPTPTPTRPAPQPGPQTGAPPAPAIPVTPSPKPWPQPQNRPARPPVRTKERKFRATPAAGSYLGIALNIASESVDVVEAVWYALPPRYRSKPQIGHDGRPHRVGAVQMAKDIYLHADQIDLNRAMKNILVNQLGDAMAGAMGRKLAQGNANMGKMGHWKGFGLGPAL